MPRAAIFFFTRSDCTVMREAADRFLTSNGECNKWPGVVLINYWTSSSSSSASAAVAACNAIDAGKQREPDRSRDAHWHCTDTGQQQYHRTKSFFLRLSSIPSSFSPSAFLPTLLFHVVGWRKNAVLCRMVLDGYHHRCTLFWWMKLEIMW